MFAATVIGEGELTQRCHVEQVGECDGVEEVFFAITRGKRIEHGLVRRITGGGAAPAA
ncbi:MAG: hypothetical protein LW862_22300 [Rubrivivax sp.]|nr:hypothetical protein [Rubrivivax sp.]